MRPPTTASTSGNPLTTVRPPFDAVARAGLDLLLAQIVDEVPEAGRVVLAPELIIRDSVAPPGGPRRP